MQRHTDQSFPQAILTCINTIMRSENEIIGALLVIVQRDPRYPFIFDIRSGIEAHAWAIPATKLPTSCQTVCRRGRIAAHSGRACANGTRDAPSRLIKLKKLRGRRSRWVDLQRFFCWSVVAGLGAGARECIRRCSRYCRPASQSFCGALPCIWRRSTARSQTRA
jgi:hypothetical protein